MVNDRAPAYICIGNVCRPPVVEASELVASSLPSSRWPSAGAF